MLSNVGIFERSIFGNFTTSKGCAKNQQNSSTVLTILGQLLSGCFEISEGHFLYNLIRVKFAGGCRLLHYLLVYQILQATENFNAESTNAKIQKSQAVNEAARLRNELDSVRRDKDQVHCTNGHVFR